MPFYPPNPAPSPLRFFTSLHRPPSALPPSCTPPPPSSFPFLRPPAPPPPLFPFPLPLYPQALPLPLPSPFFLLIPCLLISLQYGRAPQTAYLCGILGHIATLSDRFLHYCYPFQQCCMRLGREARDARVRAKSLEMGSCAAIYGEPWQAILALQDGAFPLFVEQSNLVDSCLTGMLSIVCGFWACEPLALFDRRVTRHRKWVTEHKHGLFELMMAAPLAAARCLRGLEIPEEDGPAALPLRYDPASGQPRANDAFFDDCPLPFWARACIATTPVLALVAYGEYAEAWRMLVELFGVDAGAPLPSHTLRQAFSVYHDTIFTVSLVVGTRLSPGPPAQRRPQQAATAPPGSGSGPGLGAPGPCDAGRTRAGPGAEAPALGEAERAGLVARLEECCAAMRLFAEEGPQNYRARHLLMRAELERARGFGSGAGAGAGAGALAAAALYEEAQDDAELRGFHHIAALACERLASLLDESGLWRGAAAYRASALRHWKTWGAAGRARSYREADAGAGVRSGAHSPAQGQHGRGAGSPAPPGGTPPGPASAATSSRGRRLRIHLTNQFHRRGAGARAPTASGRRIAIPSLESLGPPGLAPAAAGAGRARRAGPGSVDGERERERESSAGDSLNWETLLEASQCLSREIELSTLLERLVAVVLEIAGAQRGFLILEKEEGAHSRSPHERDGRGPHGHHGHPSDFAVEASGEVLSDSASPAGGQAGPGAGAVRLEVLQGRPLAECEALLCVRAVKYCIATEKVSLLQDCMKRDEGPQLQLDAYVVASGVKSILALPITHQGRVVGCLYLENRLLRGAFTPTCIETLTILSSQLAISVTNARLYESLRRSNAENEAVLHNAHDAIVTLGEDLAILSANPASERLWGRPSASFLGQKIESFLTLLEPQADQRSLGRGGEEEGAGAALRVLVSPNFCGKAGVLNAVWKGLARTADADRTEVEVCITSFASEKAQAPSGFPGTPLSASRRTVVNYAVFVRDVSAKVKMEEQLAAVHRRWFAMVTHDLRTPLNGIMGCHQLLAETALTAEQREYVDGVGSASGVLLSLMDRILEYSRLEEQRETPTPAPFDLVEALEGSLLLLAPAARAKDIHLVLLLPRGLPRWVFADNLRIRRIIMNFMSNAMRYTPRGGRIELRIESERCPAPPPAAAAAGAGPASPASKAIARASGSGPGPAGAGAEHVRVRIAVTDTGPGIPPDQLHLLFRPYQQLPKNDATRMFEGTGLGLAITKRLAEAMGGSVGVTSERGAGCTFYATVVVQRERHAKPAGAGAGGEHASSPVFEGLFAWPDLRGVPCLIAAREPAAAIPLTHYLADWGARVEAVEPSEAAGAAWRLLPARPLLFAEAPALVALSAAMGEAAGELRCVALAGPSSRSRSRRRRGGGGGGAGPVSVSLPLRPSQLADAVRRACDPAIASRAAPPPAAAALTPVRRGRLFGSSSRPPSAAACRALALPGARNGRPEARVAGPTAGAGSGAGRPESASPAPGAGRGCVLLVDDIPQNVLVARRMLEIGGYAVETAEDGLQCIEAYRVDPAKYDMILLDVEMPVCDGREACRRIRAMEAAGAAPRIPIVFMTANAMAEDREEAMRLGADAFFTKPVRRHSLLDLVARHSRPRPRARAPGPAADPGPPDPGPPTPLPDAAISEP
eukprot:tig00000615_g2530.t1